MKNLACKSTIAALVTIGLIFIVPGWADAQDTPKFNALKASFDQGQIFNAEFSHRYEDSFTGEVQENEGTIWIGKERYKIEANNQVMVVDGDISRVYDASKNRVIISDYIEEEDDFAPSRMLQGVDESYSVTEKTVDDNHTEIILVSDDPFSIFSRVTITLGTDGNPQQIRATDQAENQLITSFRDGLFMEVSEDLFQLNAPEKAERIDLRYNTP